MMEHLQRFMTCSCPCCFSCAAAIGQWRLRAVCKNFRALAQKIDPAALLQEYIPRLLVARKSHQLLWSLEELSAWVVWLAPNTTNGHKGQVAHRFAILLVGHLLPRRYHALALARNATRRQRQPFHEASRECAPFLDDIAKPSAEFSDLHGTRTPRFLIYTLAYTVRHVLGCDTSCQHTWAELTTKRVIKVCA